MGSELSGSTLRPLPASAAPRLFALPMGAKGALAAQRFTKIFTSPGASRAVSDSPLFSLPVSAAPRLCTQPDGTKEASYLRALSPTAFDSRLLPSHLRAVPWS
eukprot:scaffold248741_cov23-Tisochrysis_lutea.AAC.4